jgi:hypothetical protein
MFEKTLKIELSPIPQAYHLKIASKNRHLLLNKLNQGAWHSPNTLPTIVHRQVFRIMTCQPPPHTHTLDERAPLSAI